MALALLFLHPAPKFNGVHSSGTPKRSVHLITEHPLTVLVLIMNSVKRFSLATLHSGTVFTGHSTPWTGVHLAEHRYEHRQTVFIEGEH